MHRPTFNTAAIMAALAFAPMTGSAQVFGPQQQDTDGRNFQTVLSGAQEVPPVSIQGGGNFEMQFDPGLSQAQFTLSVNDTNPITAAHLHCARAGVNGPVVVTLFTAASPGGVAPPEGALAEGTITSADVTPPQTPDPGQAQAPVCDVPLNNLASLFAAILDGRIYVNAHTPANPEGEVRGQLFAVPVQAQVGGQAAGPTQPPTTEPTDGTAEPSPANGGQPEPTGPAPVTP